MVKPSLFIDAKTLARLRILAKLQGVSVEFLIERAIHITYPAADNPGLLEAFEEVVGIWSDRKDLGSTRAYVRRLRTSTGRKNRLGL